MTIGICTRYTHHEMTYVAIRLANWLKEHGNDVSLFTMTSDIRAIDPYWDRYVQRNRTEFKFSNWARPLSTIIWTHVPHPAQVTWVNNENKKSVVFLFWHTLTSQVRSTLLGVQQILCPTMACFSLLYSWGLRNLLALPWDPGCPLFTKPRCHLPFPKLFVPLWDGNARRSEMTLLDVITRILIRCPKTEVGVAYSASTLRPAAVKKFQDLKKASSGRLHLLSGVPPCKRPLLFQQYDLTLWATHFEDINHTGLMSIQMGTPIMGFEFTPTTEILREYNSIPVPCQSDEIHNDVGLPRVVPDYAAMDDMLHDTLRDPGYIQELQSTVTETQQALRDSFDAAMRQVLV